MSEIDAQFEKWHRNVDDSMRAELDELRQSPQSLQDAFYRELSFGTAGLRGILGAGPNRMNVYTV